MWVLGEDVRKRDMGMRALLIANMLLREASYGPSDYGNQAEIEERRERIVTYALLLLGQLRLGYYGRKKRAIQRAFGVSDEALASATDRLATAHKQELEWA